MANRDFQPYATPVQRGVAYLLDFAFVFVIWLVYEVLAFGGSDKITDTKRIAVFFMLNLIYYMGFMLLRHATPAKMLLGMRIERLDGASPEPPALLIRYVVFIVTILVPFGPLISGVLMWLDPDRRTIHDRVAGTVVRRTG